MLQFLAKINFEPQVLQDSSSVLPGPWEEVIQNRAGFILQLERNMAGQNIGLVRNLSTNFVNLRTELEENKFFRCCISEGLLPKGLRSKFNLARDINDQNFVKEIEIYLDEEA